MEIKIFRLTRNYSGRHRGEEDDTPRGIPVSDAEKEEKDWPQHGPELGQSGGKSRAVECRETRRREYF